MIIHVIILSHHVTSYHIVSYHIISYPILSYPIISDDTHWSWNLNCNLQEAFQLLGFPSDTGDWSNYMVEAWSATRATPTGSQKKPPLQMSSNQAWSSLTSLEMFNVIPCHGIPWCFLELSPNICVSSRFFGVTRKSPWHIAASACEGIPAEVVLHGTIWSFRPTVHTTGLCGGVRFFFTIQNSINTQISHQFVGFKRCWTCMCITFEVLSDWMVFCIFLPLFGILFLYL